MYIKILYIPGNIEKLIKLLKFDTSDIVVIAFAVYIKIGCLLKI